MDSKDNSLSPSRASLRELGTIEDRLFLKVQLYIVARLFLSFHPKRNEYSFHPKMKENPEMTTAKEKQATSDYGVKVKEIEEVSSEIRPLFD